MSKEAFIKEVEDMGFSHDGHGQLQKRNRSVAYDNDCSDDERDDGFYEEYAQRFSAWYRPIAKKVTELATKHAIKIEFETSTEYGIIEVHIK